MPLIRLEIDYNYIVTALKQMIRINSVLPDEEELADYIAQELKKMGVEPELHEVEKGRLNVYARKKLGNGTKFLIFSGHSDTVEAASDWKTDPFEAYIRDGLLYGLGAINMKSGLSCMLAAFKAVIEQKNHPENMGTIGIAVTVDQEGHSKGAKAFLETDYADCDAMLHAEHFYGDSEQHYLPNAVTGKVLYRIKVRGRAGHAFRPQEGGINAVEDAARIIKALDGLKLKKHPLFCQGTVCVLKVEGGYKMYSIVVPEKCDIVITRLTVPGESSEYAQEDMERLIKELELKSTVEVEMASPSYDPYLLDEKIPFVDIFKKTYEKTIGNIPCFAPHRGIVDANIFYGEGGIPTIVFGPKGRNHHQAGEYVELDSLLPVARIYAETALEYLSDNK